MGNEYLGYLFSGLECPFFVYTCDHVLPTRLMVVVGMVLVLLLMLMPPCFCLRFLPPILFPAFRYSRRQASMRLVT